MTIPIIPIIHLFGTVLGMGGAIMSHYMFYTVIKDTRITTTELRFLKLGAKMVWVGLLILFASGTFLYLQNPEKYHNSTKFLAKMTIVLILVLNGLLFHFKHIPLLARNLQLNFAKSEDFVKNSTLLLLSGTISLSSWLFTLGLGRIPSLPYSYLEIMFFYFIFTLILFFFALKSRKRILSF